MGFFAGSLPACIQLHKQGTQEQHAHLHEVVQTMIINPIDNQIITYYNIARYYTSQFPINNKLITRERNKQLSHKSKQCLKHFNWINT